MPSKPKISIVAIPIGHPDDITLRAIQTLREADAIVCEEIKEASKLLKHLEITGKELIPLNEHNEIELVPTLLMRLVQTNQHFALISDCGTPGILGPRVKPDRSGCRLWRAGDPGSRRFFFDGRPFDPGFQTGAIYFWGFFTARRGPAPARTGALARSAHDGGVNGHTLPNGCRTG